MAPSNLQLHHRTTLRPSFWKEHLPIILLLLVSALIYLGTSFQPSLVDDADATHAEAAKEMLLRHDWVTLYVNGVRYLEKAPLLYWLVATAYQVFGFTAFAVRLPTMLSVLILAGVMYGLGRWAYSPKTGFYAAIATVSCIGMFLFTRIMIPEALLTLLLAIAHACFLRAYFGNGTEKRFYYGFYAASALAVLTKGLIGVVFAIVPAFLFLWITGTLSRWKELRLGTGSLLFLEIAAPWHLLAGVSNDHFFWFYFVNEHILRFIGQRYPKDYNKLPFLQYWLFHLVWLFPWSLGFPLVFRQFPRLLSRDRAMQIALYLWLWAAVVLLFFNFSSNQEYYTFPAYPALLLLLSHSLVTAESKSQRFLVWLNGGLAAIALGIATALGVVIWQVSHLPTTGDLSSQLSRATADSEKYSLSLGHILDLTPQAFSELRAPALAAALVLAIGFSAAFWLRRQHYHTRTTLVMLFTMLLLFVCANRAHAQFEPILSSRPLADAILQRWEPGAKIIFNGEYETGASIAFYTNQHILLLNGRKTVMEFGSHYPDAPPIFLTIDDVRTLWNRSDRLFLFTENLTKDPLVKELNLPVVPLTEAGGKTILMNKP